MCSQGYELVVMLLNGLVNVTLWNTRVAWFSEKTETRGSIKLDFQVDDDDNFNLYFYCVHMGICLQVCLCATGR